MTVRAVIVDDNPDFLDAARSLLEREGVSVAAVAATTAGALRCAAEHDPDVVLVDIGLGSESGFDVAELLSPAAGPRWPVILISARPEQDYADLLDASPAIGFLAKPELSAAAVMGLLRGEPAPG